MTNEIKKINIPENVLVALGDLTNGALNYYKATETVNVRHNAILDYITNLQNKLEEKTYLYNKLDTESKYAITNLQEENEIIDKIKKLRSANTHIENIYYAEGVLLNEPYCDIEDVDNEELLKILKEEGKKDE